MVEAFLWPHESAGVDLSGCRHRVVWRGWGVSAPGRRIDGNALPATGHSRATARRTCLHTMTTAWHSSSPYLENRMFLNQSPVTTDSVQQGDYDVESAPWLTPRKHGM